MIRSAIVSFITVLSLLVAGCGSVDTPKPTVSTGGGAKPKSITLGMIAKANNNQVFQVARTAGQKTCDDLSKTEGVEIKFEWRTPDQEDAGLQARNIESLATICQGIAVSCTDGATVMGPIDAAVGKGVSVMCFDSDSPNSKRMCYFGTDDTDLGKQLVAELIKVMGDKGVVGMLCGNQTAPNLQKRTGACRDALKPYPNIKLAGPTQGAFYCDETPQGAAAAWTQAHTANPEITGWILVGGWPLFTQGATKALGEPGKVKVVSCDALPEQLGYVRDGSVQVLLSQDLYGWGEQSVKILVDKILHGKNPPSNHVYGKLTRVTKENVEEFAKNWEVWAPKGK